jgi:predicted glutamine amidotransferase
MFMHNGLIGNWSRLRRKVEQRSSRFLRLAHRHDRLEAVFLAIWRRRRQDPVGATSRVLATLTDMVSTEEHSEPLRFTAALANGQDLYAFRFAANDKANTLYYRESGSSVVIVSSRLMASTRSGRRCRPATCSRPSPASRSGSSRSCRRIVSRLNELTSHQRQRSMPA